MRRLVLFALVATLAVGCGERGRRNPASVGRVVDPTPSTTTSAVVDTTAEPATTTTTVRRRTSPPITRAPGTPPSTTTAAPPTTAPPLSPTEASVKLCGQIEYADEAVVRGNFIAGGLRLGIGIADYGEIADPTLVQLARQMLSAGKAGDAEGYVAARGQAAARCQALGRPIAVGGIQCVTTPCP